jgi:hypothetical protein
MGLLGGLDLPLIGSGGDDDEPTTDETKSKGQGGGLPDMFGIGKAIDNGLDWMDDTGIDKYVGAAAGVAGAGVFTGVVGMSACWELGKAAGDKGGDVASGLNLFSAGEEKA